MYLRPMEIGHTYSLRVNREVDFGVYLDSEKGEILLPKKYIPENTKIGDSVAVFVHRDSEDRLLATTLKPYGEVGDLVVLHVKDTMAHGAFMDWGLEKDLFVPKAEQHVPFRAGMNVPVRIAVDHATDRLLGTSKLQAFLKKDGSDLYKEGDQVEVIMYDRSELGMKVIVDRTCLGLIFASDIHEHLKIGDVRTGYIRTVREDGKLDVVLNPEGKAGIDKQVGRLEQALLDNEGFLPLTDKSDPEEIRETLGMSKKAFKKALGGLYKSRKVSLSENGIHLNT